MVVIYGVDTEKKYTALDVRNAVIECFAQAHLEDLKGDGAEITPEENQKYTEKVVRNSFEEAGADFDNPTKEGIVAGCKKLASFVENFRSRDVTEKHFKEIMTLVEKL